MFYSKAEPRGLGRLYLQNKLCAIFGGALRGSQNESEYKHTVNLKMAENRIETFMEISHSVSVLRPVMVLKKNNVFSCRVVFGSVGAIKIIILLICIHINISENAHGPEPAKTTCMINDVQNQVHCQSIPHLSICCRGIFFLPLYFCPHLHAMATILSKMAYMI